MYLAEGEQQSHVRVNALLLQLFTGADALPCGCDLHREFAVNALKLVQWELPTPHLTWCACYKLHSSALRFPLRHNFQRRAC